MRVILTTILFLLLLSILPTFGLSQERPETIVIPVSSVGDVTETRKLILQNTLEDELKTHFRLISQDRFEKAQEKAFEELEYEECTEERCIILIQEMLQVENVFHLQVIGEGNDTQLSLSWRTLDEKRKEEEFCEGCKTSELRNIIKELIENIHSHKIKKIISSNKYKTIEINDYTLVASGEEGTVITSSDLKKWNLKIQNINLNFTTSIFNKKDGFRLFGDNGVSIFSKDGSSWNYLKSKSIFDFNSISYGKNIYIASDKNGKVYKSNNLDWKLLNIEKNIFINKMIFFDNKFYGVGKNGYIIKSKDGILWETSKLNLKNDLIDFYHLKNKYVFLGGGRSILYSDDLKKFKKVKTSYFSKFNSLEFGKNKFIVVGDRGKILTSLDGFTWKERNSGTKNDLNDVIYSNNNFIIVGSSGTVLSSKNGKNWYARTTKLKSDLKSIISSSY